MDEPVEGDLQAIFFIVQLAQGLNIQPFVFLAGEPMGLEAVPGGIFVAGRGTMTKGVPVTERCAALAGGLAGGDDGFIGR